jgi:hypothetical protein
MSEQKWTPGEHFPAAEYTNGQAIHARLPDGREVETAFCENPHDVHLYAAAPALVEALEGLGGMPDGFCVCFGHTRDPSKPEDQHTGECQQARAALRAAKGET